MFANGGEWQASPKPGKSGGGGDKGNSNAGRDKNQVPYDGPNPDWREKLRPDTPPDVRMRYLKEAQQRAELNPQFTAGGDLILPEHSPTCDEYSPASCEGVMGVVGAFPGPRAAAGLADDVGTLFKSIFGPKSTAKGASKGAIDIRPPLSIPKGQFGHKWGQHAKDYGLDPSDAGARAQFRSRIRGVHLHADQVRRGQFRGMDDAFMFRRGEDLLITKPDGTFVSMYPGASASSWFKKAEEFLH